MVAAGRFALVAFVGGASAMGPSSLAQADRPAALKIENEKAKPQTPEELRRFIWSHAKYTEEDIAATGYSYPNHKKPPAVVAAEEEAKALHEGGKDHRASQLIRESHVKQQDHKATAKELKETVRSVAMSKVPPMKAKDVEWSKEESPECAKAPWPPAPEVAAAATNLLREETRLADQGKARVRSKEEERKAKASARYFRKCAQIFAGLDFDGDDAIEEAEVFAFFDAAWERRYDPMELTQKFLNEADKDHDGRVSADEWRNFAREARKISASREERWDPLVHLRRGASSIDREDAAEETAAHVSGYYKRIATQLFHAVDADGDGAANGIEMQAFLGKKYPAKDPVEFSEKVLAEADTSGDGSVNVTEFLDFATASREKSANVQEMWNPLLRTISAVRRKPAPEEKDLLKAGPPFFR